MFTGMKNHLSKVFQIVLVSFAALVLYANATQVRAIQQGPTQQKDVEITWLKARIAELEQQQAACLKPEHDPALHEPAWAGKEQ